MGWSGLERNKLDYILTDLLPVEISELFSFSQLYAFLLKKENQKILDALIQEIKQNKAQSSSRMFEHGWSTKPLKYKILKGTDKLFAVQKCTHIIGTMLKSALLRKDIVFRT